MSNMNNLIERLKSWTAGYIAASARMDIDEAITKLLAQQKEIQDLRDLAFNLETQIVNMKMEKTLDAKPPAKRTKKAVEK